MAVVAKSRSSLHKEKCDFNKLVLNKILYLVVFNTLFKCLGGDPLLHWGLKFYGIVSKIKDGEGHEYYMKMLNLKWKSI